MIFFFFFIFCPFIFILEKNYAGQIGVVTGWGRVNETSSISPLLRQVEVPIFSNPECQKTKYGVKAITDNMMCAGYDHGKLDACQVRNPINEFEKEIESSHMLQSQ